MHPADKQRWGLPASPLIAAACAAVAAAAGGLYALGSYTFDEPRLLPIAGATLVAIGVGLWRLEYGLAVLVLATPFAENAPISQPGEAKLRVALTLWAVVLTAIQVGRVLVAEHRLVAPPMAVGAACFLVAALLAVPIAPDEQEATSKFMLLAGGVVIYLLIGMFLTTWRSLMPVLTALLIIGLVISGHALFQYLADDLSEVGFVSASGTIEYRISSFFPHPNQLAGFVALFVPLGAGLYRVFESSFAKAASVALVILSVLAVTATFSRGGLIGLAALAFLYVRNRRAWPIIAVAFVLIAALAPSVWKDRVANAGKLNQPEIATRVDLWGAAGQIFAEHPVLGVGLNNFKVGYVALERPGRSFLPGTSFGVPETAHNLYLNTLAEQGLVGAAALLVLILSAGRMILLLREHPDPRARAMSNALVGVGVVLIVHNLFDLTFLDSKTSTIVWVLFGIGAALHRVGGQGELKLQRAR